MLLCWSAGVLLCWGAGMLETYATFLWLVRCTALGRHKPTRYCVCAIFRVFKPALALTVQGRGGSRRVLASVAESQRPFPGEGPRQWGLGFTARGVVFP